MIFNFYPWKLDVDIEATKQFYAEKEYVKGRNENTKFYQHMTKKQKYFFDSLGVDVVKMEIEEKLHDIPEEDGMSAVKLYVCTINFLICGKIVSLPDYQKHIYEDEEVFGKTFPDTINVIELPDEELTLFDVDGLECAFKHPCFHFDNKKFKNWDCGYILGTILIMNDL